MTNYLEERGNAMNFNVNRQIVALAMDFQKIRKMDYGTALHAATQYHIHGVNKMKNTERPGDRMAVGRDVHVKQRRALIKNLKVSVEVIKK